MGEIILGFKMLYGMIPFKLKNKNLYISLHNTIPPSPFFSKCTGIHSLLFQYSYYSYILVYYFPCRPIICIFPLSSILQLSDRYGCSFFMFTLCFNSPIQAIVHFPFLTGMFFIVKGLHL